MRFYLCIQRPLQLQHVGVLLGIDVVIWKIHQETVDVEPKVKCVKIQTQSDYLLIEEEQEIMVLYVSMFKASTQCWF